VTDEDWRAEEATIRQMSQDDFVHSILREQAEKMEAIRSFGRALLFPDFTGDDYSHLESAVLNLVPATTEEVHDVEQAVADTGADPETHKIIARIADQIPNRSEIGGMTTWAGFLVVAAYMYQIAPPV